MDLATPVATFYEFGGKENEGGRSRQTKSPSQLSDRG
jgi:hypothetical protein